ncbi:MAG: FG-GAP-like repeat-containing protein [Bacteroidetes bacterium]|nr:FG-GAP-like repeat-containing protein [Bacteroidota bacterium]MCL2302892.1 FG-GAP-like repeat-containing protein [Lentimicrobiaceae bacterium]
MITQLFNTCFHRTLIILFLHIIFTTGSMLQAQNSNPVGAIPGVIDVSPMGAATYTIPIEVVPGTQGTQPNLSIVYNSMGGMGLLGMKWNLAGLSAITRCGKTPYYDNDITAIQFGTANVFAIDGERLINTSTINANGILREFATEMENFIRVYSHGSNPRHSPTHFTVYTDDGNIIEYGNNSNTNNSKHKLEGGGELLYVGWYVNKIKDANNNYMTFHYGQANNEIWINEINYTGNTDNGMQTYAKVEFTYINNTLHPNTYYVGGYGIPQTKLLSAITVSYNNAVVRKYQFNYNLNDARERTAHLKNIVLFGEGGAQLDATTISWNAQHYGFEITSRPDIKSGNIVTGDFNGDGYTDYVRYNTGALGKTWELYLQNPTNGTFYLHQTGQQSGYKAYAYSCDYTGKGRDALILAEDMRTPTRTFEINVYEYESNYLVKRVTKPIENFSQLHFGDFNGDGKVNIMYACSLSPAITLLGFFNNDFTCSYISIKSADKKIHVIDYNGNGKANLQFTMGYNTYIYEYSAANQRFEQVFFTGFPTKWHHFYHGDFNGDGITDIITFNGSEWRLKYGLGDGYYTSGYVLQGLNKQTTGGAPRYPLFIADINGDGKDDILQPVYTTNGSYYYTAVRVHLSQGGINGDYQSVDDNTITIHNENYQDLGFWHLGDFNGDGKNDLLLRKSTTDANPRIIYFNKNEQYEYVKEITDGLEKKITIAYTPRYLSFMLSSLSRGKKAFMQLATEIQTPNGIGGINTLKFRYGNDKPVYSSKRRAFLGFKQFVRINTVDNITTIDSLSFVTDYEYFTNSHREMLLPYDKHITKNVAPSTINKISYGYNIIPLPNPRFILHNSLTTNQDFLSDTKTETITTLENGRVKTSNTTTFFGNALPWMHSETSTYTYNTITINGYQKKTVPTQIITRQQYAITPNITIADTITYNYFGNGRLNWVRQGNLDGSITTTYSDYTPTGLYKEKTISTTGLSRKEYYDYDITGRFVTKTRNHLLHEATMSYDAKTGNKLSETDINGLTTAYQYDSFGNLTKITYPDNTQTNISINWYASANLPNAKYSTKTTATGAPELTVYYDILGREACRLDDGNYFKTIYNKKGQIEKTIGMLPQITSPDSEGIVHQYFYDNHDRKSREIAPYTDLSFSYDKRKITVTDNLRAVSSSKDYDALGRIINATDHGGSITYGYSMIISNGRPRHRTSITTNRAITTILADLWGNRLSIDEPNAGEITSKYNGFNELIEQKDAKNNITTYQYDVLGRVMQKEHKVSNVTKEVIKYVYDTSNKGKGKLHRIISNSVISDIYSYDAYSRLCKLEKGVEGYKIFRYTYTPTGQLDTLTYPDNFSVTYHYTSTGKLSEIRNSSDNSLIYKVHSRNKYNAPTRCEYGNGVVTDYTYNPHGLPTRIKTGNKISDIGIGIEEPDFKGLPVGIYSVDSAILNYRYAYDTKALMTSRSESVTNRLETYEYDKLDRLTKISSGAIGQRPTLTQTLYFEPNGNIGSHSTVGMYFYGSKPHAVSRIDPNGNTAISTNQCDIIYNVYNQPSNIAEGDYSLFLGYRHDQQRYLAYKYKNGNVESKHLYISKHYEIEMTNNYTVTKHYNYIYGDHGVVALNTRRLSGGESTGDMYYIHTDHLGSYCAITDANKQVRQRSFFDPWGNVVYGFPFSNDSLQLKPIPLDFKLVSRGFTGHEHYPNFKIINMNGRLYDPVIGRFFSPDKYVANSSFTQDFNRYTYARNNPLMYTDPSGDFIFSVLLAPIGLAGLGVIIDGACWSAAFNTVSQGVNIALGRQEKFSWAQLGGAAVGGAVFAGMGLMAPTFSVASTSFTANVGTYLGKAAYTGLTAAVSRGSSMLFTDIFTKGKEITGEDWIRYAKGMGISFGTAFGLSFTKSMIDYATWDRYSVNKKMDIIHKKYGEKIQYNPDLTDDGRYQYGFDYAEIGPSALSENRGYAFSTVKHELKHMRDYRMFKEYRLIDEKGFENMLEINSYKLEMQYHGATSRDYLRSLRIIRNDHGYRGFAPFNPFILLNPFFHF